MSAARWVMHNAEEINTVARSCNNWCWLEVHASSGERQIFHRFFVPKKTRHLHSGDDSISGSASNIRSRLAYCWRTELSLNFKGVVVCILAFDASQLCPPWSLTC